MVRHADSIGTRTCRFVHSQGHYRSLPVLVVVLGLGGGTDHAAAQASWRGLVVAPEARCAPYDAAAYPVSAIRRGQDRRRPGRRVRALHRPLVREPARHRHRTHRGPVGGTPPNTTTIVETVAAVQWHCQLVEGSALLPREIDAPDRSQQAHVTASHSTNARVRSRRW